MNYDNELNKHINIQAFKKDVLDRYDDNYIYFITFTFLDSFNSFYEDPIDYLRSFKQKIIQSSINHPSKHSRDIYFLCIREMSHDCKSYNRKRNDHYHCFLIIPKKYQERFYRRAVESVSNVYYDDLQKDVPKLILPPKVYKNIRFVKEDYKEKPVAINYDIDVRFLQEKSDVETVYNYATKNISFIDVNYTRSQLNTFRTYDSCRMQKISIADEKEHFILL